MSVFLMKILAVVSMLIDHTAIFLFPRFIDASVYTVMRAIGRFAFPVFAYLIVNGYEKTRDVKRYLTRLLAFAVISQITRSSMINITLVRSARRRSFFSIISIDRLPLSDPQLPCTFSNTRLSYVPGSISMNLFANMNCAISSTPVVSTE